MSGHKLAVQIKAEGLTVLVHDYAAAMVLGIAAVADQINAMRAGEIRLPFGRRHGVRVVAERELTRVPVSVDSASSEADE